jgi:threonine dehydrogenase-like Zn-dependent dehydrogenase
MSSFQPPTTMRAVVYKGPHEVAVEDKPYPKLQTETDCILKVTTSALCGSDLHFYRGHLDVPSGFVCGHEFVGEIVEKGSAVKNFTYGEKVSFDDSNFLFLGYGCCCDTFHVNLMSRNHIHIGEDSS